MKQIFQITDKQKSLFRYMHDATLEEAEKVAVEECEFYKVETRVYQNGFVRSRFVFEDGKAVKQEQ